jgi:hypothetical protein
MTDRQRAHEILKEAKEALTLRLTELVLESGEEILADARGESYMNEIETLYEQVGMKLGHVSQMLSNVPAEIATPPIEPFHPAAGERGDTFTLATEPSPSADAVIADTTPALVGPVFVATPALPAPQIEARPDAAGVTFQQFAERIQDQDMAGAGAVLATLLGLSKTRAVAAARTFARRRVGGGKLARGRGPPGRLLRPHRRRGPGGDELALSAAGGVEWRGCVASRLTSPRGKVSIALMAAALPLFYAPLPAHSHFEARP